MERNRELFYKVAEKVEAEPTAYNQGTWVNHASIYSATMPAEDHDCGTTGCIAGWTLLLNGDAEMIWQTDAYGRFDSDGVDLWIPNWVASHNIISQDGRLMMREGLGIRDFSEIAGDRLGLAYVETTVLFNSEWAPVEGLSVAQALRGIGDGGRISELTQPVFSLSWPLESLRGYEHGERDEDGYPIFEDEGEDDYEDVEA